MKDKVFFWLKTTLGFSRKEARGFLWVIPILILLSFSADLLRYFKNQKANRLYERYIDSLDSMEKAGFTLVSSPLPTFNPQDTVRNSSSELVKSRINRLPFSEADSVTLQIVPGIGSATASRIIKYRERLGGFHSKDQLKEVFGLKPEVIEGIWEYFDFDPGISKKIKINTVELEELSKHPYISFQEAKVLIAFKKQHGNFNSPQDLLKIKIFREEWVKKIAPYLQFDSN
ncbi:ComEA family DNA-binding protein [Algoriphagus aquatilis]|uniref:ComEA family DNA-binding protein n=1 Tax=Algoriphagus aquatilis TaxID=490186 RepID=A0ABW0BY32_9BACT